MLYNLGYLISYFRLNNTKRITCRDTFMLVLVALYYLVGWL